MGFLSRQSHSKSLPVIGAFLCALLTPLALLANYQGPQARGPVARPAVAAKVAAPAAVRNAATTTAATARVVRVDDTAATGGLSVQNSIPVDPAASTNTAGVPSSNAATAAIPTGARGLSQSVPVSAAPAAVLPPPNTEDPNLLPMMLQMAGALLKGMPSESTGKNHDADAEMRATAQRADALNSYVGGVTSGAPVQGIAVQGVPPATCTSCLQGTTQDPRFERCSNGNGYLEDVLAGGNLNGLQALQDTSPSNSTVTCVAERMRTAGGRFNYCSRGHGGYGQRVGRPCASERMVRAVASAFELTSECLAGYVDPATEQNPEAKASLRRALFQLINHESGFVPNSVSSTEAGGMGQLTRGAIQHINREEFGKIQARIRSGANPACRQLAKTEYRPMEGSTANGCERLALQNGNPQLNLMYSMAHMRLIYDQVAGQLERAGIPENTRTPLLHQLLVWGHNVGSGGMGEILRLSLARHGGLLRAGQIGPFLQAMQQDTAQWHRAKGERDPGEPTRFLAKTQNDLASLERRVNGSCGVIK